jgi:hypothetical protein
MIQSLSMKSGSVLYASVGWVDSNGQVAVVTDTAWESSDPAILTAIAYPSNTLTAAFTSVGPTGIVLVKAIATTEAGAKLETAIAVTVASGEPTNGSISTSPNPPAQTFSVQAAPPPPRLV